MKQTSAVLAIALLTSPLVASQQPPQSALIRDVVSGNITLVVKADGTVIGWGRDPGGRFARPDGPTGYVNTPIVINLPSKALQVAVGGDTSYVLLDDGTGEKGTIVAWGPNDEGQLGNGPMGANGVLGRSPESSITPVRVTGLKDIIQIEAGAKHALALRKDGTVWAWGTREDGALGDGAPKTLRPVFAIGPIQVPGLQGITQIAATHRHNLALRSDGKVMAWGLNHDGQLGNGTRNSGWTPSEVTGLDLPAVASAKVGRVVAVAAGFGGHSSSAAVRDDGTMWTWGTGTSGVAGNGAENPEPDQPGGRNLLPLQVQGLTNVKSISIGFSHAAALLRDGTLRMWGHNGYGQIGVGTSAEYHYRPMVVKGLTNVASVHQGPMRSFAVRTDGSFWVWGWASASGPGILGKHLRVPTLVELP